MDLTEDELRTLLAQGEGRTVEFKQGLPRDAKTARTLCAFANTRGGYLLVGVDDKGVPCGAPNPRVTMAALRRIASERVEPPLSVQVTLARLDGLAVVAAHVPASREKPHAVLRLAEEGGGEPEVVVRVGASNRAATGATLAALRNSGAAKRPGDPLERRILDWIAKRRDGARTPGGDATVARFAQAHNVGIQRARRAFTRLEREGFLVAHGTGAARVYGLA